jgi:hypothetical protein
MTYSKVLPHGSIGIKGLAQRLSSPLDVGRLVDPARELGVGERGIRTFVESLAGPQAWS